jgi:hypothetical protein
LRQGTLWPVVPFCVAGIYLIFRGLYADP